jgi:membrane protease YdiL (CAAX protease family)
VIFMVFHFSFFIGYFLSSILFGLSYEKTKNLFAPILAHMVANGIGRTLWALSQFGLLQLGL